MIYVIGIDLGGSSIKAIATTPTGENLAQHQLAFDPERSLDWAVNIRDLLTRIETALGSKASHIGLSAPGLVDRTGTTIAHMPGRLHGLEGLNWAQFLGCPSRVPVLNDAHAALLGETWIGAARGINNVILLTLGTGVGGAAMVDGHLLRGHIGRAGHFGHVCLNPKGPPDICRMPSSLELAIGNCTIQERSHGRFSSTHALVEAHLVGDPEATRIWQHSVRCLACAIASFVNILDPELVLLGGGIARSGDALLRPLTQHLREIEWQPGGHRVQIRAAELGEYAGAYGAALNALHGAP